MSFRSWLSIITFILIAVIIFFSRKELLVAWELLGRVNIWILLLLIPLQILSYFAVGEMIFSYLRSKKSIGHIQPWTLARLSLEMNFVNHILPSGGVSGVSYMAWRLGGYGVSAGRATMAQVVRFTMGFAAYIVLLLVALFIVTMDGSINRWIILVSAAMIILLILSVVGLVFLISSPKRIERFAVWMTKSVNKLVRRVTFGRVTSVLVQDSVSKFFVDMHTDFVELRREKRILIRPFLWGLLVTASEVGMFTVTFLALGEQVNPAPIMIAFGVATFAGVFFVTPGGAGAYEAVMVAFITLAGVSAAVAIAGIVLTRVILLLGTIILGYVFYQLAIIKYGKNKKPSL